MSETFDNSVLDEEIEALAEQYRLLQLKRHQLKTLPPDSPIPLVNEMKIAKEQLALIFDMIEDKGRNPDATVMTQAVTSFKRLNNNLKNIVINLNK